MTTAIWWARRDLRLIDNQVFAAASSFADRTVPVSVPDPVVLDSPSADDKSSRRRDFEAGGICSLGLSSENENNYG